ncbi:MAG: protein kinase domain-containing protein [Kofleriaceae bacterium]
MSDPSARTETLRSSPRAREAGGELQSGQRLGRFVIERTIGAGGMGTVFAARDPDLDRLVAIKVLHAGTGDRARQQRLLQEARAIARLRHPNVVVVHEVGEHERRLFVVMELVEGPSLREWLGRGHGVDETLAVLVGAARGLAHAHAQGITHRDFKPENLMIDADGNAKVVDFGIAELDLELREGALAAITQTGEAVGTPPYMAPEQLRGEVVSPACDQFSWCITLLEALVGARPVRVPELAAIAAGATPQPIELPASLPSRARAVLVRGLSASANDRFASMEDLLAELEPPARKRWPLAVAGGLAVGVAITASMFALRGTESPDTCTTGAARIDTAWNARAAGALSASLGAFAPRVTAALEDRAHTWRTSHTAVCRATASPTRTHRMSCLDDSLANLRAFVDFWSARPASVDALRSVGGAGAIPDPRACETAEPTAGAPPRSPAEDALFARLEQASVARSANAWERSVEIAHAVADEAKAIASDRVLAKARIISGDGLGFLLKFDDAQREIREAIDAAARGKEDVLAAHAWGTLITHIGVHEQKPAEALSLATAARAAVARLGGAHREIELRLHLDLGRVMYEADDFAGARTELEKAVAIADAPPRQPDKLVGEVHFQVAAALMELGEADNAVTHLERALEAQRRAYGEHHPAVAQTLQYLGVGKTDRGDHTGALVLFEQARAAYEASIGTAHPLYASTLGDIATAQMRSGSLDEALANMQRETDVMVAAYGLDHPITVDSFGHQIELARAFVTAKRAAAARVFLDRARTHATGNPAILDALDAELAKLPR